MEAQMRDVREKTIRGLEPEVQRMVARHKEEIASVQAACQVRGGGSASAAAAASHCRGAPPPLTQEQLRAATATFEAEKAAAVARARRDGATTEEAVGERDKEAWRARETALRAEHDRELAALRSRHATEVEEERRRSAAALRAEVQRYSEDVAKATGEWQARLDESVRRQLAERDEWAKRLSEAVAAEAKVRGGEACALVRARPRRSDGRDGSRGCSMRLPGSGARATAARTCADGLCDGRRTRRRPLLVPSLQ